jgi:hypothetical protein
MTDHFEWTNGWKFPLPETAKIGWQDEREEKLTYRMIGFSTDFFVVQTSSIITLSAYRAPHFGQTTLSALDGHP